MRALQTRCDHPYFGSGALSERSTRNLRHPRREGHGVPVLANPDANDRLDSWKEIASHFKRTVRTVQRWERHEGLPVHRHLHQRANSVYASKSELDEWWNHEPLSLVVEPPQVPSDGSRPQLSSPQVFRVIQSEKECREAGLTPPKWFVEWVQEPPEAEISSAEDGTGHIVCVLRVRIRIEEYLLQAGLGRTTPSNCPSAFDFPQSGRTD
jgi:hypothetical protein